MNWLKVAFGLIREAAGTEVGQEVINNMRSSVRKEASDTHPAPAVDMEALMAEHRSQVNRSLDAIVEKLNEQNSRLEATIRRQRIWNYGLAAALVIVLVAAMIAAAAG
jgi:hypothetical protein